MPRNNLSKPHLQRLIEGIRVVGISFVLIAGLWGNISDSLSLINIKAALILTFLALIIASVLWLWAKYRGIKWNHSGSVVVYRRFDFHVWLWLTGVFVAIWIGPFTSALTQKDSVPTVAVQKPYTLGCNFPLAYNRDTLYILVTRFETDVNKIETECFGRALRDRIDEKASQNSIPIKICYSDSLYPRTHSQAKEFQRRYNADLVLWGDIANIENDCSNGDFCFYSQPSDSLIKTVGGKIEVESDITEYQENINPKKIREGKFNIKFSIKDYNFNKWLLSIYNVKIGGKNPDFYVIDRSLKGKDLAEIYLQRANLYYQFNRFDKALNDYNKAITINSKLAIAYYTRANVKYTLGDEQGALQDLNKFLTINPNFANAYSDRGVIKDDLGDKRGALKDFNKALTINPNLAESYTDRGVVKYTLGDRQGALRDHTKALKINPSIALAYTNRGVAKADLGNKRDAIEDYTKALAINPNFAQAYFNRGYVKHTLGDQQGATEDYNKAIQIDPTLAQ